MAHLGFVGLGEMGGRATKRLLDAGHTVTGYNRTRSKAQWLLDAGMQWGESPRAVAAAADIIFTMVTNTRALQEVTGGQHGILAELKAGKIFIDMSTVSPSSSRHIAAQVAETGAQMLDAPISGSLVMLEQGTASLMVGGDQAAFERVKAILQIIGPKVTYVGGNGQAALMKIAINLSLTTQFVAFSEGILLAEKAGIPRETALEVWLNSAVAPLALQHRGHFILKQPETAWFDVNMMQKDLLLALELGRELDVPLSSVALSNELLTAARAMKLDKQDFSIMFEVLARLAGVSKE